jgi:hypothetical protein
MAKMNSFNSPTRKKDKKVDWDELLKRKDKTRISLKDLSKLFGSMESESNLHLIQVCNEQRPWA